MKHKYILIKYLFISLYTILSITLFCDIDDSIVQLKVTGNNISSQLTGYGTGFFLDDRETIVTAYHVIKNTKKIEVIYKNKFYRETTVSAVLPEYDIAILKIKGIFPTKLYSIENSYQQKTTFDEKSIVFVNGFAYSDKIAFRTKSEFVNYQTIDSFKITTDTNAMIFNISIDIYRIKTAAYSGVSGSPVIVDGKLLGILSGSTDSGISFSWIIPIYYINFNPIIINKKPNEINIWPAFTLYNTSNFRSLVYKNVRNNTEKRYGYLSLNMNYDYLTFNFDTYQRFTEYLKHNGYDISLYYNEYFPNNPLIAGLGLHFFSLKYCYPYKILETETHQINDSFTNIGINLNLGYRRTRIFEILFDIGIYTNASQNISFRASTNIRLPPFIQNLGIQLSNTFLLDNSPILEFNQFGSATSRQKTQLLFMGGIGLYYDWEV